MRDRALLLDADRRGEDATGDRKGTRERRTAPNSAWRETRERRTAPNSAWRETRERRGQGMLLDADRRGGRRGTDATGDRRRTRETRERRAAPGERRGSGEDEAAERTRERRASGCRPERRKGAAPGERPRDPGVAGWRDDLDGLDGWTTWTRAPGEKFGCSDPVPERTGGGERTGAGRENGWREDRRCVKSSWKREQALRQAFLEERTGAGERTSAGREKTTRSRLLAGERRRPSSSHLQCGPIVSDGLDQANEKSNLPRTRCHASSAEIGCKGS